MALASSNDKIEELIEKVRQSRPDSAASIPRALELALLANIPVYWEGLPGTGKTATVNYTANVYDAVSITMLLSIHDPSDVGGLPVLDADGRVFRMAHAEWVGILNEAYKRGKRTILFLDELPNSAPLTQASALRVIEERVVGDMSLPPDCFMIAAGNSPEHSPNGHELSPPLANRFMHFTPTFNPKSWTHNFPTYWGIPPKIGVDEKEWLRARCMIAAFLNSRPQLVLKFPDEPSKQAKAWASPRTWDKASRILAVANNVDDALQAIAGLVGDGPAGEMATFVRTADLPDPDDLLKDPTLFKMEKWKSRGDILYAILASLHASLQANNDAKRYGNAWKIFGAVADAKLTDIAAAHIHGLTTLLPKGTPPPAEIMKFTDLLTKIGARKS